jgi:hypothetical protein
MPSFDCFYEYNLLVLNLFTFYLRVNWSQIYFQKTAIGHKRSNQQKKRLWKYLLLIKVFYKAYYNNKKAKNLPNHYAISLIYQFFFITAQKNKVLFINQRRHRRFRILKLFLKARFKNRKMRHSVRYKRGLYKLKILFDRLFV